MWEMYWSNKYRFVTFKNLIKLEQITEGLFIDFSALWWYMYEMPMTVPKILDTVARGPLGFEALGFSLTMHMGKSDTRYIPL